MAKGMTEGMLPEVDHLVAQGFLRLAELRVPAERSRDHDFLRMGGEATVPTPQSPTDRDRDRWKRAAEELRIDAVEFSLQTL